MATKTKIEVKCAPPARIAALLRRATTFYMGPCCVNASGGWTRVGPTWDVPGYGWIVWGPGAERWGTTMGLAELAVLGSAKPKWHASAWVSAPKSNAAFHMEELALESSYMIEVRAMADAVDAVPEFVK